MSALAGYSRLELPAISWRPVISSHTLTFWVCEYLAVGMHGKKRDAVSHICSLMVLMLGVKVPASGLCMMYSGMQAQAGGSPEGSQVRASAQGAHDSAGHAILYRKLCGGRAGQGRGSVQPGLRYLPRDAGAPVPVLCLQCFGPYCFILSCSS